MGEINIRKSQLLIDKIWHDGGPALKEPRLRGAILTVVKNPFAGRYVEDIQPFMKPLELLGVGMARELAEALGGPKAVQSYGKAAIVGLAGELEHGALWHAPGGYSMREVLGGTKAIVPSTKKVRPARASTCRCTTSTPPTCAVISTPSRSASTTPPSRTRSSTSWPWAPAHG